MKLRSLLPLFALLSGIVVLLPAGHSMAKVQPPQTVDITITDDAGQKIKVRIASRASLLVKTTKRFSLNKVEPDKARVPAPPAEFDFTKDKSGNAINLPIHGNDRYGDCFPVACFHVTESQLARQGKPTVFKDADITRDYFRMSPNDQGTSDSDIIPWWKAGIPSNAPANKLIDYALIDPSDTATFYAAMYHLGGCVSTHELRTSWESINGSGFTWDNTGRIDPNAGHAIAQHGVKGGNSILSTWGMTGYMTPAGMQNSNAEIIAVVSTAWFDAKGYTPNGTHYSEIATYWKAAVGHDLPPGLYPAPTPSPPPPATINLTASPTAGIAPLSVTFTGTTTGVTGTLDFGDSTSQPVGPNSGQISATHIYAKAGTYTATLSQGGQTANATITVSQVGPTPPKPPVPPTPPTPGFGITGTETVAWTNGVITSKKWVEGSAPGPIVPNVNKDTHKLDLAKYLSPISSERRRERVRARIIATLSDNEHADVKVDGDVLTFTRKAAVDPSKWLAFLEELIPLILKIMAMFGG